MKIQILPSAKRELANLPLPLRQQADKHILSLQFNPRPQEVQVLSAAQHLYDWQHQDYRIAYQIREEQQVVAIVKISLVQN